MRVLIVGAGILGTTTAYYLACNGIKDVHVIDQYCPGAGATGRSGALIRSNYDNEIEAKLAEYSIDVFRNFSEIVGGESGFQEVGLAVFSSVLDADSFLALSHKQRDWGVDIEVVEQADVQSMCPFFRCDDTGLVLFQSTAGYCDSNLVLQSYYKSAKALGVRFYNERRVIHPVAYKDTITGVHTDKGTMYGDIVVLAAGAWTNSLLESVDLDLGLTPQLTRVAVFKPFELENCTSLPIVIDNVQEAWFRPMPGGSILVGCEKGVIGNISPDVIPNVATDQIVDMYRDVLTTRFQISRFAAPRGAWAGAFMVSPDHMPLVGKVNEFENLYIAGGDSGGAFKTAPAIGTALANVIANGEPGGIDIGKLCPNRIERGCRNVHRNKLGTISR